MSDLFDPLPAAAATRRKENTRARLVRASLDVFVEKGVDGATVDDLVRAAGFTRGAFYSNFSSREEVFEALFEQVTDELLTTITREVAGALPQPGAGRATTDETALLVTAFEAIRPYGRQWYLLYSDAVARSLREEALAGVLVLQRDRLRDLIGSLIAQGMEAAGERSLLELEDLAQLVVGLFIDLMVRELLDGRDVTELAAVSILGAVHAFLVPVGPPPGVEGAPPAADTPEG